MPPSLPRYTRFATPGSHAIACWSACTEPEVAQVVPPFVEPRGLTAGAGVDWIGEGWRLFAKSPLMWVISVLVLFVLAIVVNIVPFLGGLAFQLLQPVFGAGFIVACRSLETGGEFELEHIFAGFKKNFANLFVVG